MCICERIQYVKSKHLSSLYQKIPFEAFALLLKIRYLWIHKRMDYVRRSACDVLANVKNASWRTNKERARLSIQHIIWPCLCTREWLAYSLLCTTCSDKSYDKVKLGLVYLWTFLVLFIFQPFALSCLSLFPVILRSDCFCFCTCFRPKGFPTNSY